MSRPHANGGSTGGPRAVIVVAALCSVALVGFVGVRVKAALGKRAELSAARVSAQASAATKAPIAVTRGARATFRPQVEVTGTLEPWRSADIGFEQQGRLASLLVSTGDLVKQGQPLAFLDAAMAGAQINQAEAQTRAAGSQLALAQDNLRRTESLIATRSIPEAQAVAAREQVELARAQLEGARATERLSRTGAGQRSINAPFAGLVTKAPTTAGGVASPGVPLIRIEDHVRFRLAASLSEADAGLVKVGSEVSVKLRDRSVRGRVTAVVPSLDQATRRAPVEIEVQNDKDAPLLAWSFVRATIEAAAEQQGLALPASVRRPGAQNEVIVVKDGKLHISALERATFADGSWFVSEGLSPTDAVVLAPDADAREGDPAPLLVEVK